MKQPVTAYCTRACLGEKVKARPPASFTESAASGEATGREVRVYHMAGAGPQAELQVRLDPEAAPARGGQSNGLSFFKRSMSASTGIGSGVHLAGELFKSLAKIDIVHVPYKGVGLALPDMVAGKIQMVFYPPTFLQFVKEGKLRWLAGAGGKRFQAYPDLPAIAETVSGVAMDVWLGVFMPAGVPKEIVRKANADIIKVLQLPEVKNNLAGQGIEVSTSSPEALMTTMREDHARWGKVIKEANIKVE